MDTSYKAIVSSSTFVLLCYFYVYSIASYFDLPIVVFQNGFTTNTIFENTYLIDKNWDLLVILGLTASWLFISIRNKKIGIVTSLIFTGLVVILVSTGFSPFYYPVISITLPFVISLLILNKTIKKINILNDYTNLLIINYVSIIIIVSSVIGIFLSSSLLLFSIPPSSVPFHNYTYPPYVLFSNLAPLLVLVVIFSLFIKIIIRKFDLPRLFNKFKESRLTVSAAASSASGNGRLTTKIKFFYLLVIIILSVSLFLIPQNPAVNKTNQLIGVDVDEYIRWESKLINSISFDDLVNTAFTSISAGDRPLTLLFMLLIVEITPAHDPSVLEYFPLLLLPLFILTVFFLTKELFSNDTTALFSAFLSGISFHLLIGTYAGLYANWLALVVGYLAVLFFFKYLKGAHQIFGIFFFISVIILLFTHVYTWVLINTVLVVFVFILIGFKLGNNVNRKRLYFLLLAIAISVIVDVIRIYLVGISSGVAQMNVVVSQGLGIDQLYHSWENLSFAILIYVGGIFSNIIIYALVIYWSVRSNIKEPSNMFMFIFLSIGTIPFLIGDEVIQARSFYDIPFQIPAAVALTQIMRTYSGKMLAFALCMWVLFTSVRTLFNLYVISPK